MLKLILAAAVCLFLMLSTDAFAAADPLAPLRAAAFHSVEEITVQLPHGHLQVWQAIVATLPEEAGAAAVVLGPAEIVFDSLPSGHGALNLFAEMNATAAGTAHSPLHLPAEGAYLSAAATSGVTLALAPGGSARAWAELTADEQAGFEELYLQAAGDSWTRGRGADFKLIEPVGGEVYLAFWASSALLSASAEPRQARYDYRVQADSSTVTLDDYARGITLVQAPWAPEEGELDENMTITTVGYSYSLAPGTDTPGRISATARVGFELAASSDSVQFISAPWFGLPVATPATQPGVEGLPLTVFRGGTGNSDWVLNIRGSFAAGENWLDVSFPQVDIPEDFRGPGYAGVYRLDTTLLWPGEQTTNVGIAAWLSEDGFKAFSSSPFRVTQPNEEREDWPEKPLQFEYIENPQANRNEMLVLTRFPSRAVPTAWGTLNITAPEELLDDTAQLAGVQSLEAMVGYFLRAWGDPRTGAPCPTGVPATPYTLNVFFIPGESGVQAFEDAGMVFILGGQQSYGGQGGGQLPLIAHEVAHVWWGHGVAAPRWFTEGMANYAAAKFVEHYYGDGGPASGQGDPLSYRRYLINFGLGSSIPVGLARRDALDDSAAIYHESAGFLLTADNRLPGGLDPVLAGLYSAHVNGPALDHAQLGSALAQAAPAIAPLWETMVEGGQVESAPDDPAFRELVRTPARENYVAMLGWLNPAYRKNAAGDYAGAYYAMRRALAFRSEPKDRLLAAELALKAGRPDAAREHAGSLAGEQLDDAQQARLDAVLAGL